VSSLTGSETDDYSYTAFGKSRGSTGTTPNSQQYKGQNLAYAKDADLGPDEQYGTHYRQYDPDSGRYTSEDPAKDDLDLYRYVRNNPVSKDDPAGLQEDTPPRQFGPARYLGDLKNGAWFRGDETVGRILNFGPDLPGDLQALNRVPQWVSRRVRLPNSRQVKTFYAPYSVVTYYNSVFDVPDDWDDWFAYSGYEAATPSDVVPILTGVVRNPVTGDAEPSNAAFVTPRTFESEPDGRSFGGESRQAGLYYSISRGSAVFIDEESGIIIPPDNPPAQQEAISATPGFIEKAQKPTGIAQIDHWNRLIRKGDFANLLIGHGGLGEHTLFVAGGAHAFPRAQRQAINNTVRSAMVDPKAVPAQSHGARRWVVPRNRSLMNAEVRQWYDPLAKSININRLPTEANARAVHAERNALKQQARDLMANRAAAARLEKNYPIRDFDYYVKKYSEQGYKGEALWMRIMEGGQTPNAAVSERYGID